MNSKTAWNALIILAVVLLVCGPVVANQFYLEMARWHLAAATNALGEEDQAAEAHLQRAGRWAQNLDQLRDYWLFRIEEALADPTGDVSQVIEEAMAADESNRTLGINFATNQLVALSRFGEAVEVLEVSLPDAVRGQPVWLNQIAYFRALATVDLDVGLREINQALQADPEESAYRDTRGWLLFQMGRPLEALEDANFAIQAWERPADATGVRRLLEWLGDRMGGGVEPRSPDRILTRREAGDRLWTEGALRYHRARILESLGRTAEAEADFEWLREHNLPADDRLY